MLQMKLSEGILACGKTKKGCMGKKSRETTLNASSNENREILFS